MRVKNVRPKNTEAAAIECVFTHTKEHICPYVEGNRGAVLVEFLGSRTELEDNSKKNAHQKKFIFEEVILVLSSDLVSVGRNKGNPVKSWSCVTTWHKFGNFDDTLTVYPGIDLPSHTFPVSNLPRLAPSFLLTIYIWTWLDAVGVVNDGEVYRLYTKLEQEPSVLCNSPGVGLRNHFASSNPTDQNQGVSEIAAAIFRSRGERGQPGSSLHVSNVQLTVTLTLFCLIFAFSPLSSLSSSFNILFIPYYPLPQATTVSRYALCYLCNNECRSCCRRSAHSAGYIKLYESQSAHVP